MEKIETFDLSFHKFSLECWASAPFGPRSRKILGKYLLNQFRIERRGTPQLANQSFNNKQIVYTLRSNPHSKLQKTEVAGVGCLVQIVSCKIMQKKSAHMLV